MFILPDIRRVSGYRGELDIDARYLAAIRGIEPEGARVPEIRKYQ
jgi:hypothetical protein